MRKLLLTTMAIVVASCATYQKKDVVLSIPKGEESVSSENVSSENASPTPPLNAYLKEVPVLYALKAFCKDQQISCDFVQKEELKKRKVTLPAFNGRPEDFLSYIEKKAGVEHKVVGGVYIFQPEKLITVKAVNLPLGDFLKVISEKLGDYSISIGKKVDLSAPVTVLASRKPVGELVETALSNLGYSVQIDPVSRTIFVSGYVSKTIKLPSFFSNLRSADLSASTSVYGGSGSGSNTSSSMRMQILSRVKSDFERTLQSIIGSGRYSVNYDLGELYVEGNAENVKRVEEYVASLAKKLSKQVLIDVAVIEQRVDTSRTIGIDWSAMFKSFRSKKWTISQQALGSTNGILNIELAGTKFNAVLKAIEKTGQAKIITNFRLAVPNYDIATISNSVTKQFITKVERSDNPQTGKEYYTATTEQVSESSALFVRPVVRQDGKIDVVIAPTVSSILGVDIQQFGDITLKTPVVAQKNSPLRLIVERDKTYIVGGIVQTTNGYSSSGIPYLTDVPVLSSAFGKKETNNNGSIIYVVLRTSVVGGKQWK